MAFLDGSGREMSPDYYDAAFERGHHWRAHYAETVYFPNWRLIAAHIQQAGHRRILDVGCGTGQFGCYLMDMGIAEYVGVDFSPKRIEWAIASCPQGRFVCADLFESDLLETYAYDAVVVTEVLEHITGDLECLRRIRPQAYVYGSVPSFPWISHVRYFEGATQVQQRYQEHLEDIQVETVPAREAGQYFYVFHGRRRQL